MWSSSVRRSHRISPQLIQAEGIRVTCNSEFSYERLLREEIFLRPHHPLIIKEIQGRSAYDSPFLLGADRRIFLKRVPARVKESDLVKYFSKYGEVQIAMILKYRVEPGKKNSGLIVGHVIFEDPESQTKATQSKNFCMRGCKLSYEPFVMYLERRRLERPDAFIIEKEGTGNKGGVNSCNKGQTNSERQKDSKAISPHLNFANQEPDYQAPNRARRPSNNPFDHFKDPSQARPTLLFKLLKETIEGCESNHSPDNIAFSKV